MNSELSIELPQPVARLIDAKALNNYTVGGPNHDLESAISNLDPNDLFFGNFQDEDMAACCLSGIWLLHNFLDASHEISQDIHSHEGSYWHGIMHRLEGDFGNSKYWYRNVGSHPIFESILDDQIFDPYVFVDQCQSAQSDGSKKAAVQAIAVAEWKALFEYCHKQASATS